MTDNKALIKAYFGALNGHPKHFSLVQQYVTDPALAQHIAEAEEAFPRYEIVIEDMVAEGDRVAVRGMFRGVHRGTFAGIPASGSAVSAGLMIIYRVEDDRIVQHWMEFDRLALLQQLQSAAVGAGA